jgi:hypothetical protein
MGLFLFSKKKKKKIHTDNGGHPLYYSIDTALFSQAVYRPWQEINRSTPTHSEDKNEWTYSSLSPVCLPAADREHPTLSLPVSYSDQRTTARIVPNWKKIHRSAWTSVTQPNVTSLNL